MKCTAPLALTIAITTACSGGTSEPLPIRGSATLAYELRFFGLGSDEVTVFHEFTRQDDGSFEIRKRIEGAKKKAEKTPKPVHCDANGIDAEGNPHCFFAAAKAPIFMPLAHRREGSKFHGFRVKQELEWNGQPALRVSGRDNWDWYYSRESGLFLGGKFEIGAGGIAVKLTSVTGFGSS